MKRFLQAICAALMAAVPHAAPALEVDTTLDRFPSAGQPAVSGVREWRGGARDEGRTRFAREPARFAPALHEAYRGRDHASSARWTGSGRYRTSGSLIEVRPFGGAVERGSFYGTAGTAQSSSIVVVAPGALGSDLSTPSGGMRGGPKILDVATDRLDRLPYGRNGLAVAHVGTAKIIRIGPDFRSGRDRDAERDVEPADEAEPTPFAELPPEEQAVTVYPDTDMAERPLDPPAPRVAEAAPAPAETPAPAPAPTEAAGFLEPWTPDWLRDCVARHADFDVSLGTYTNAEGQRRFCTGEP
ncbi:hypothetical protein D3218_07215 [Aureimonas flava]|uniref:Lectin-like protein BA14k n=1 Tax=Aureimonas flava TaxID=2320271 RepID=A0A3A1WQ08_9HYPH|nr:hypothetical protein [Aureimonas flava]RIY02082.1 hypothetical protein D3218_07215 [Aureimonas flava]